jgi:hypothetical protein
VFAVWFAAADAGRGAAGREGVLWLSPVTSAELLTLPFTGMRGFGDPAWAVVGVWAVLCGSLQLAWLRRRRAARRASARTPPFASQGTLGGPLAPAPVHWGSSRIGTNRLPERAGSAMKTGEGLPSVRPKSGSAREQP